MTSLTDGEGVGEEATVILLGKSHIPSSPTWHHIFHMDYPAETIVHSYNLDYMIVTFKYSLSLKSICKNLKVGKNLPGEWNHHLPDDI